MVSDTLAPQKHFLGNSFLIMKLLYTFVTYQRYQNMFLCNERSILELNLEYSTEHTKE